MNKNIEIQLTDDGSMTLYLPHMDEHYHSVKGALAEAEHVYINTALNAFDGVRIRVLEVGFGTGLNGFLTLLESERRSVEIDYTSLELYPLTMEQALMLDYPKRIAPEADQLLKAMHLASWNERVVITDRFTLYKRCIDLTSFIPDEQYDVIYFDAFAPEKQPELWNETIFKRLYESLRPNGVLSTYCAKGVIRRMLQSVGFTVERLAGPVGGKREILRARK